MGTDRLPGLEVLNSTPQLQDTFESVLGHPAQSAAGALGATGMGAGFSHALKARCRPSSMGRPSGVSPTHHFLVHSTTSSW